jgi:hypothetical protein
VALTSSSSLLYTRVGGDTGRASRLTISARRTRARGAGRIVVSGRLSPARGNERVTVSVRAPGTSGWAQQTIRTAANGSFTTSWRVRRGTTTFVAQWAGDLRSVGDGSPALRVRVGG